MVFVALQKRCQGDVPARHRHYSEVTGHALRPLASSECKVCTGRQLRDDKPEAWKGTWQSHTRGHRWQVGHVHGEVDAETAPPARGGRRWERIPGTTKDHLVGNEHGGVTVLIVPPPRTDCSHRHATPKKESIIRHPVKSSAGQLCQ